MPPDTFAITFPVVILASPIVPEDEMVPPVMPLFVAILVTVPVPATDVQDGLAAAPPVVRTCPPAPGARTAHPVALRYKTSPCVDPIELSIIDDREFARGVAVPPVVLDRTVLEPMPGSCASEACPDKLLNPGCDELGTPDVEIVLIH